MTINSTHPQVDNTTSQKKPWFLSQLFKTLLITGTINLILWGGVIATLPFFGPEIEHLLFPSIKKIQNLRNELDRVHVIQDEKSKELATLTEKTHRELAILNESLNKLSDQIKALHDRVSTPTESLFVPESNEIATQWNALLKNFEKGEPFEAQLHALDPFIGSNKDILMAVHELVNISSKKTSSFDKLAVDLLILKEKLTVNLRNDNAPALDSKNNSWIDNLWEKAKSQISSESLDQAIIKASTPSTKEALIKAIEATISLIEKHQFNAAISTIKEHQALAKPLFDQWLLTAETRFSAEQKIEVLRQRLTPLLTQKVN